MPIPNAKHKKLKELLKEDSELLQEIEGWFDSGEAKEKVQKANDDISKERDLLKDELKQSKEKLTEVEAAIKEKDSEVERLQSNMLTDDDKQKFEEFKKSGVSSEMQKEYDAKINKLADTVNTLTQTVQDVQKAKEEADQKAAESVFKQQVSEMEKKLTTAFTGKKITGKNAELALLMVKDQKLAELKSDESGSAEKYFVKGEDGQFRDATIDELADHIATNYEQLVDSSGISGGGINHQSDPYKGGGNTPLQIHDIRNAATDMIANNT